MGEEERSLADDWLKATTGHEKGDALRKGPFVRLSRNGAVEAGAEATEMVMQVAAGRGLDRYDWAFELYGSESRGQVACLPVPLEKATRGSALVRWYTGKGAPRAAWHIGGALRDFSYLRLKTNVQSRVAIATWSDGLPVLILPVRASLGTQTQSRSEEPSPGAQAGAGGGDGR